MLAQDPIRAGRAPRGKYLQPERLGDALAALSQDRYSVLAGGTDFYPARVGRWIDDDVLDISRIAELRAMAIDADRLRLGATMTWSDVLRADLPGWCEALRRAAREVGGVQIQNAGTLAGNLCNASPAADGVPVLLALDAKVELASRHGHRLLPLADFILGSRKTARTADELVTAIHLPQQSERARSTFAKLGARKYLVISIVMVAASIDIDTAGHITRAGIAVGSCSALAQRLRALEARLIGRRLDARLGDIVETADFAPLLAIDDVRGTAPYRHEVAQTMVARALNDLGNDLGVGA